VSSVTATNESVPLKKSLSGWQGVLIGIGLFLSTLVVGFIGGYTGNTVVSTALVVLIVLVTSAWVAFDSVQIRIREYKTALASHPVILFVAMVLLWVVIFPWYLVARSKIRAGCLERREHPNGLGFAILLLPVGVLVVVTLVSAVLFISAGGPIKNIWVITNNSLAAASAGEASTPASTVAAMPSAQTTLLSYVGKEPDLTFFKQDMVQAALKRVFSPDEMNEFAADHFGYLAFEKCQLEDGHLFVFEWGGRINSGEDGNFVAINIQNGEVILAHQGDSPGITIQGDLETCDISKLPKLLQHWIEDMRSRAATTEHIAVEEVPIKCGAGVSPR